MIHCQLRHYVCSCGGLWYALRLHSTAAGACPLGRFKQSKLAQLRPAGGARYLTAGDRTPHWTSTPIKQNRLSVVRVGTPKLRVPSTTHHVPYLGTIPKELPIDVAAIGQLDRLASAKSRHSPISTTFVIFSLPRPCQFPNFLLNS